MLVGAVLGPHQREHRQLDVARLTAETVDDQRRIRGRSARARDVWLGAHGVVASAPTHALRIDSKIGQSVGGAGERVDSVLGMGHQAEHVARAR